MRVLRREDVRELDRQAIENYGIPGIVLMENAGRGATELASGMLPSRAHGQVAVISGRGNNGGDGFVVARHLHNRGHRPTVLYLGDLAAIPPGTDAGVNAEICRRMGILTKQVRGDSDLPEVDAALRDADLVVDAIFGTGLCGEVRGLAREIISRVNAAGRPALAIDLPSGIDANTGAVLGVAVRARETATFGAAKLGLTIGEGPAHAGVVTVVEISIPRELLEGR